MKLFHYRYTLFVIFAFISLILTIGGCAPKQRAPVSTLDTPEHHVFTGMKLLETGKLSDADSKICPKQRSWPRARMKRHGFI